MAKLAARPRRWSLAALCCFLLLYVVSLAKDAEVSLDQFLSIADDALAEGDAARASDVYRQGILHWTNVVKNDKDHDYSLITVLSLHTNAGTTFSSLEDSETAIALYTQGLEVYRDAIDTIMDQSVLAETTAIAAQAAFFLGMVYQDAENKNREALASYDYAVELDPLHWASLANAASVYHDRLRRYDEALKFYNQAYALLTDTTTAPTDPPEEPRFILSQLQYRMGLCISSVGQAGPTSSGGDDTSTKKMCVVGTERQDCTALATHAFSLAIEYDPDNEAARHMLASLTADATMQRASNTYVTQLFDEYASNFEHSLVNELQYTGYERLRRGFDRSGAMQKSNGALFDLVVDAGCGTGLVGEQFRNVSRVLIGVDLSAAIVAEAQQKRPGLYNETIVGDIIPVFRDRHPIGLIVAADSYIYFGDLDPLFAAMRDGLQDGGFAAFTLENASDEAALDASKPDWKWQLTASGRFAHRKDYAVETAKQHGMQLVHYEPLQGECRTSA